MARAPQGAQVSAGGAGEAHEAPGHRGRALGWVLRIPEDRRFVTQYYRIPIQQVP